MRAFLIFLIVLCIACNNKPQSNALSFSKSILPDIINTSKPYINFDLAADSGYITTRQAVDWELYNPYSKEIAVWWKAVETEAIYDTIGKFFKTDSNTYVFCTIYDRGYFLTEAKINKGRDSVIAAEPYGHANYNCCVKSIDDGFKKTGGFYCLKTCNTGSAYCGTAISLFKHVTPYDEAKSITIKAGIYCDRLRSSIELKGNDLKINYTAHIKPCDESDIVTRPETKRITVNYHWLNNKWIVTDSSGIEKLWDVFPF